MSTPKDDSDTNIGHLISAELLSELKKVFPLQRPLATESERKIWIKSGNQEVIEFLEMQFNDRLQQAME